jgi:hypothetical protein
MSAAVSIADPDQLPIATIRTPCVDAAQQASPFGWKLYVGSNGAIVGIARERLAGANAG